MIAQVVGAGLGAMAANMVLENFLLQTTEGGPGFIKVEPGFGVDDVVRWALIGIGATAGYKIASKFGGG